MTAGRDSARATAIGADPVWQYVEGVRVTGGLALVEGRLVPNTGFLLGAELRGPAVEFAAGDDEIVVPGLVDLHCHLRAGGLNPTGVDLEQLACCGVLGAADAGSFGPENVSDAIANLTREVGATGVNARMWSYLYGTGIHDPRPPGTERDVLTAWERMHMAANAGVIVGLKVRLGQSPPCGDERLLEMGRAVADRCGVRLMVHLTGSAVPLGGVLARLRRGDVLSHAYHGRTTGILDESGRVSAAAVDAYAQGVVFDTAHGRNHFSWRVFEAALAKGLLPGTVSTDVTTMSLGVEPVRNLLSVMSKLVGNGLGLESGLRAVTEGPAQVLGLVGSTKRGAVIISPVERAKDVADSDGELRRVRVQYVARVVAASLGPRVRVLVRNRSEVAALAG